MADDKHSHHPLPQDSRARHDLIPESIEEERAKGDDAPPGSDNREKRMYRDPAGKPYPA